MKQKMVMWLTAFVLLAGSLSAQETKNDARTERKRPDFAAMQLKQVLGSKVYPRLSGLSEGDAGMPSAPVEKEEQRDDR